MILMFSPPKPVIQPLPPDPEDPEATALEEARKRREREKRRRGRSSLLIQPGIQTPSGSGLNTIGNQTNA